MMDSRIRDPQILFRGRGGEPGRFEKRWSIVVQGPRAEEAGAWFPRDELGQGEWLWVWKWSPHYEPEFTGSGEWAFSGLPPRLQKDGSWVFEGSAPDLAWLMPDGTRLSVIEEDARGVLRVLESSGEVSLFALQRSRGDKGSDKHVVSRGKSKMHPRASAASPREHSSWRNLLGQDGPEVAAVGLLPVYLLASEILVDPEVIAEQGMRRVASLILSCLGGNEFEIRRTGQGAFRVSRPGSSEKTDSELEEIASESPSISWSMRGPAASAIPPEVRTRITRILQSLAERLSTEAAEPGSPG
jgi:hypothetical protein